MNSREWQLKNISTAAEVIGGFAFKSSEMQSEPTLYQVVKMANLYQGKLDLTRNPSYMKSIDKKLQNYIIKDMDILITLTGTNGKRDYGYTIQIANQKEKLLVNQRVGLLRAKPEKTDPKFLFYKLNTKEFLDQFFDGAKGGTGNQANVSLVSVRDISILLPSLEHQKKISIILSTWDQAIEATEKLIANSEAQKKALMQQLLTGKKRLPGFHGEWNSKTLNDLGKTYTGLSGKTKADFGSGKPFIPYKNVFANTELNMSELEYVLLSDGEKQNTVKSGDIIFTTSSETPEEVGMSSAVLTDIGELYLNSFCFGFRIKNQNEFLPSFAKHLFRSFELRRAISSLAQGSTRYNLSKNEFLKISIQLPTKVEQERIVEVLDAVETAHSKEQKKLQNLRVEKSVLMQQLLTGKRRVAINKEEAA